MTEDKDIGQFADAQGDELQILRLTVRMVIRSHGEAFEQFIHAACIPHWFDRSILAELVTLDQVDFEEGYRTLVGIPFVQSFGNDQYYVHEAVRKLIRSDLFAEEHALITELSGLALKAFEGSESRMRIERAYHLALASPENFWVLMRQLLQDFYLEAESAQVLGSVLKEFGEADVYPARMRGWSLVVDAVNAVQYLSVEKRSQLTEAAVSAFEEAGSPEELGYALLLRGDTEFDQGQYGEAERTYARATELLASAHMSNESTLVLSDFISCHDRWAKLLVERQLRGDLDSAIGLLRSAKKLRSELLARPDVVVVYDQLSSHYRLGDLLSMRGKLEEQEQDALEELAEDLHNAERLCKANPSSLAAERDLTVAYDRLAHLLLSRGLEGDVTRAEELCRSSLKIRASHHRAFPESTRVSRSLFVSHINLSELLLVKGDDDSVNEAMDELNKAFDISSVLKNQDPGSMQSLRDYCVALVMKADLILKLEGSNGNDRAWELLTEASLIKRRVIDQARSSAKDHRDLSVVLAKLAALAFSMGKFQDAFDLQREGLSIRRALYEQNSHSAQAQRDLSVMLNSTGDLLYKSQRQTDWNSAHTHYKEALVLRRELMTRDPGTASVLKDYIMTLYKCSKSSRRIMRLEEGKRYAVECLSVLHRMKSKKMFINQALTMIENDVKKNWLDDI